MYNRSQISIILLIDFYNIKKQDIMRFYIDF